MERERCGQVAKENYVGRFAPRVGPVGPSVGLAEPNLREPDAQEREPQATRDWQQRVMYKRLPLREPAATERRHEVASDAQEQAKLASGGGRFVPQDDRVHSEAMQGFLMLGIDLLNPAYVPKYIRYVLFMEVARLCDKGGLAWEEKRVLLTLAELIPRFVQLQDIDFFRDIISRECSKETEKKLMMKLNHWYLID